MTVPLSLAVKLDHNAMIASETPNKFITELVKKEAEEKGWYTVSGEEIYTVHDSNPYEISKDEENRSVK